MEKKDFINSIRYIHQADTDQIRQLVTELQAQKRKELLLVPHPDKQEIGCGIALKEYVSYQLIASTCVREWRTEDDLFVFTYSRTGLPTLIRYITRTLRLNAAAKNTPPVDQCDDGIPSLKMDTLEDIFGETEQPSFPQVKVNPYFQFLKDHTPAEIQQELDRKVIGQQELTQNVADFLYYHAMRQLHSNLPQRPMLISGPSGSGKTEVWRVAKSLYGNIFPISIIDGSSISCDGWAGSSKISSYVDDELSKGGILVVDEFDKLVKPKHSSSGDNVSLDIQAEFLKLIEGEYQIMDKKKPTGQTSRLMGFVMVGAFEYLRSRKAAMQNAPTVRHIGFGSSDTVVTPQKVVDCNRFSDEDLISCGIMPEVVGRIAIKCVTKPLSVDAYLDIIRSPYSRVSVIGQVLQQYGLHIQDVISDAELRQLVQKSQSNKTGVRWVSAQVENRLLEALRLEGLFPRPIQENIVA